MTPELEKYIERGWPGDVAWCAYQEFDWAKSANIRNKVVMDYDENNSDITFTYRDGFKRICSLEGMVEISPNGEKVTIPYS